MVLTPATPFYVNQFDCQVNYNVQIKFAG